MNYNEQQIAQYMERIGYDGPLTLTKETLDAIIYAHQCKVPFENLDVFDFQKEIYLDRAHWFEKIVENRRGGFCFELNGIFCALLQSLGFDARPCYARVVLGDADYTMRPMDHRSTLVYLDGEIYVCEVGVGGPTPPGALRVADDCWQELKGEVYCTRTIEGNWLGIMRQITQKNDMYEENKACTERMETMVLVDFAYDVDFEHICYSQTHNQESMFCQHRVLNMRTPHGYRSLTDDCYKELADGVREVRMIAPEELSTVLAEKFGIVVTQ